MIPEDPFQLRTFKIRLGSSEHLLKLCHCSLHSDWIDGLQDPFCRVWPKDNFIKKGRRRVAGSCAEEEDLGLLVNSQPHEHEPAGCPREQEGQWHPGLCQKQQGQQD